MAPFVETEWGAGGVRRHEAPQGAGRSGRPPEPRRPRERATRSAHLKDLKPIPTVEEEVDRCIECGFCEPLCPSRDLTLTPRQRIVVRRELARLDETRADPALRAALEADFPYEALDTCAVDGLCATACPVKIDTGQLTKRFRARPPLGRRRSGPPPCSSRALRLSSRRRSARGSPRRARRPVTLRGGRDGGPHEGAS